MRLRVALWLSYLYSLEADDLAYAYPRAEGWESAYEDLQAASAAAYEHAKTLCGGEVPDSAWQAATSSFGEP